MKTSLSLLIAFGLFAALPILSQDTNAPAPVIYRPVIGRYQLVAATVDVNHISTPRLFRLDTVTGTVWRYDSSQMPVLVGTNAVPVEFESWSEISEENAINQWTWALTNVQATLSTPAAKAVSKQSDFQKFMQNNPISTLNRISK
jgi:hypothetical protein